MVATKQIRVRIDKQKVLLYEQTLKEIGINVKDDIDRHISEVIRTRGLKSRENHLLELKSQCDILQNQLNIDRANMQEYYTNALTNDVIKSLSRKTKEGAILQATYESIEYSIKKLSDTHKVPNLTVITCMRQNIYELYQDNNGELDRILKILDRIQDAELKVVA